MAKVDLSYLEEITGDDEEMILEMLNLFISDIPTHISKIRSHAESRSLEDLGKEAHKMKPTLQYVGFWEMLEIAKELESFGRNNTASEKVAELVLRLETMAETGVEALIEKRKEIS